jgi:hypothetical protein
MLMTMNIPSYVGESKPIGNVGKMENSGLELEGSTNLRIEILISVLVETLLT